MKNLYKLILIGFILMTFCYAANAQYKTSRSRTAVEHDQYGDPIRSRRSSTTLPRSSATRTPINRTSTTSRTEENPFEFDITFNNINVLLTMQGLIAAAQRRAVEKWLGEQEETFRNEINRQLGTNHSTFKNAQRDFFKNYEKNVKRIEEHALKIALSHAKKGISLTAEQTPLIFELYALSKWKEIGGQCGLNSTALCDQLSGINIRGTNLVTTSTITLDRLWTQSLKDFSEKEYEASLNDSWAQGIYRIVDNGSLTAEMVDKHIGYYNQKNLEDKVFLMTAYLVQHYNRLSGPVAVPISTHAIPDFWNSPILLDLGKKEAPVPDIESLVFKPNYIYERFKACQASRPRGPKGIYLGPDNCTPQRVQLQNLKEEIIKNRINELYPETPDLTSIVSSTWASIKRPGGGWGKSSGYYLGRKSLQYSQKRTLRLNGIDYSQFRLLNGDIIHTGFYPNCATCSEGEQRTFYLAQGAKEPYEYRIPPARTTDLDFLFDAFWQGAILVSRYVIPLEDTIILIDGKDWEGVEQSRALAAGGIFLTIIPGGKLLAPVAKIGKGAYRGAKVLIRQGTKTVVKNFDDLLELTKLLDRLKKNAKFVLDGTGEFSKVGGHHPLAKVAFTGDDFYNLSKAFSVPVGLLERYGGARVHAKITGQQNSLYSEFAKTGERLTLEKMAEIEIKAMTINGIPKDIATGWVIKALEDLKKQGVKYITNIPWNGSN